MATSRVEDIDIINEQSQLMATTVSYLESPLTIEFRYLIHFEHDIVNVQYTYLAR
ncbi:hypothetical protein WN48_02634 [Eufriesea mexicana]|uniref:Uncharacterized protein n=1 Tax=Eufriesea mexicana TaxID=516756 RepID=A0A310SL31_9HYME|nr:hypothetical protein WN48_02634 [Eufriesea mexicana]